MKTLLFLARNIRYPSDARRAGVEGEVLIRFVISENGRVRDPQVIKSLGEGTDEEALRVVLNMPSWKPAMQNGRPVPLEYVLPIEFMIDKPEPTENKEKRQGQSLNFQDEAPAFKLNKTFYLNSPPSTGSLGTPAEYNSLIRYRLVLPKTVTSEGRK